MTTNQLFFHHSMMPGRVGGYWPSQQNRWPLQQNRWPLQPPFIGSQIPIVSQIPYQPATLLRAVRPLPPQPAPPPVQQQTPTVERQILDFAWRSFDAPSHTAFRLGEKLITSPHPGVRVLGAVLCVGSVLYGLDKLDEKLDD